jgi:hypothetical protein
VRSRLSESQIVEDLAGQVCLRLAGKVISILQKMNDGLQSGDDSCLENTWDEVCAQVQGEHSVLWDLYDELLQTLTNAEVEELLPHERDAIWLQTTEGDCWKSEDESEREVCPVWTGDIVTYVVTGQIYRKAANWNSRRIRKYLESGGSDA